ncbi:hypothetical protein LSM04_007203 [Trypanosoma melophagium]|uniref:uncharacterized protein n=1 Tax=Trypanosoma melophagium TaxID=715481 RepID=UPI00351A06F4|nr:hypothetical protein LSM04_007203 [Trypanosoma melophagium]
MLMMIWRKTSLRTPIQALLHIFRPIHIANHTHIVDQYSAILCARRTLKHRSLSPNDPFGEEASFSDPSDGFYSAWSGVDMDAFANAASSEEIRTAHFGPEWSRFTTIGRLSVKKMQEEGHIKENNALEDMGVLQRDKGISTRLRTMEELHSRELETRRKLFERNYTSYEEYVEKELTTSNVDENNNDNNSNSNNYEDHDVENSTDATIMTEENEYTMPLPRFITEEKQGMQNASNSKLPIAAASNISVPIRREISQIPESLMTVILNTLGDPHGDPQLPRRDPLHWNTDDIILWLTKMENIQLNKALSSTAGSEELSTKTGVREEASVMQDLSMQEAFRMANINGEFLLQHTVPSTMFQVMRRWYLRRQEIALTVLKQKQKLPSNNIEKANNSSGTHCNDIILESDLVSKAVENGRAKLDEAVSRITPLLIQETIAQCYLYCR